MVKRFDFNNEIGQFSNETRVPCYEATSADLGSRMPKSEAGDRLEAIRDSFGKNDRRALTQAAARSIVPSSSVRGKATPLKEPQ